MRIFIFLLTSTIFLSSNLYCQSSASSENSISNDSEYLISPPTIDFIKINSMNEQGVPEKTNKRYYSINEFSIAAMPTLSTRASHSMAISRSFSTIHGLTLNNKYSFGIGIDQEVSYPTRFTKIFIDNRIFFNPDEDVSHFIFIDFGYIPGRKRREFNSFSAKVNGGLMGALGFGYQLKIHKRFNANISAFYTLNKYTYTRQSVNDFQTLTIKRQSKFYTAGVKLGFSVF